MRITSIRTALVPATAALVLSVALTGCKAGNEGGSSGDTLNGGGSTAQAKAQEAWRAAYQKANSGVTVNYDEVGSGTGRTNFISKATEFAGSDSYLTDDDGELSKAKDRCGGTDPIEVPAYVSPIAVAFNLKGVKSLNMSAETIAAIFDGKITKWNDPAIAAENKGASLPSTDIAVIHRSDDSGTTDNFTDYLSQASNGEWAAPHDDTWPADLSNGQGMEGTSGVVGAITSTDGAIGYADNSAVGDLGVVSIKVGSSYNAPSAEGAATALEDSQPVSGRPSVDMAMQINRTTTKSGAYPLLLASYLIACQTYDDAKQADLVKGYLSYAVSADGQQAAADAAGSAPLPSSLQQKAASIVGAIKAAG